MVKLYYFSKIRDLLEDSIIDDLYNLTKCIEKDYPGHHSWFYDKFLKELDGVKREIVFCYDGKNVLGAAFLKNTPEEKKICTIMINEKYRRNGIGTWILEESFKFLKTEQPLITMPDYKEKCFQRIIEKYNWKKCQTIDSYYSNNKELVFNGYIEI